MRFSGTCREAKTNGPSSTERATRGFPCCAKSVRIRAIAYDVVGFVDDNPVKSDATVYRAKIFGTGEDLPSIVKAHAIDTVLIAMPSASGREMTAILKHCQEAGVSLTKPSPAWRRSSRPAAWPLSIRDVDVEDLLGRNPVHLDESGIREKIENKVVAVTGAAGSIGSELCRQIARFHPAAIVAYDCAETALFYIDREMSESFPGLPFHPEIGDIRNLQRLAEVFDKYRPSILYHAAAYKHVPLMETHVFEAVENNVIGTWNVAIAAAEQRDRRLRHDLVGQGGPPDQRHGRYQARRRTADLALSRTAARNTFPSVSATFWAATGA